jgi:ketosteroid isomerase-like protein
VRGRNIETVQTVIEQFRTGARVDVPGLWEPDADYYPVRKFPEGRPRHGTEEIEEFFAGFAEGWDTFEFTAVAIVPVGDDRVLVRGWLATTGREAGMKLEGEMFHCVWLRHGRILRWEDHLTEAGAVKALGLDGSTFEAAPG